jgi:hypothetical protein
MGGAGYEVDRDQSHTPALQPLAPFSALVCGWSLWFFASCRGFGAGWAARLRHALWQLWVYAGGGSVRWGG